MKDRYRGIMPKKTGKNKGRKNNNEPEKRALIFACDMEEYAKITKCLGDRRILVILPDNSENLAIIPGRFRKRVWMGVNDIILVSRRDFQDNKLDVVYKYNPDEVRKLHKNKMIPDFFIETEDIYHNSGYCSIIIEDGENKEESDNESDNNEVNIDNI